MPAAQGVRRYMRGGAGRDRQVGSLNRPLLRMATPLAATGKLAQAAFTSQISGERQGKRQPRAESLPSRSIYVSHSPHRHRRANWYHQFLSLALCRTNGQEPWIGLLRAALCVSESVDKAPRVNE